MQGLFENVCVDCGELFYTDDENMTYCSKCWTKYVNKQLNLQTYIRLTKEYISLFTEEEI